MLVSHAVSMGDVSSGKGSSPQKISTLPLNLFKFLRLRCFSPLLAEIKFDFQNKREPKSQQKPSECTAGSTLYHPGRGPGLDRQQGFPLRERPLKRDTPSSMPARA